MVFHPHAFCGAFHSVLPGFDLALGFALFYLCLIVLVLSNFETDAAHADVLTVVAFTL